MHMHKQRHVTLFSFALVQEQLTEYSAVVHTHFYSFYLIHNLIMISQPNFVLQRINTHWGSFMSEPETKS